MANICLYKIKVKGTKTACYALVNMMPLYSWEKEYLSEEGTDEDYTLVFSGACKWSVDENKVSIFKSFKADVENSNVLIVSDVLFKEI